MKFGRKFAAAILAVAALCSAALAEDTIKVGVFLPLTGGSAFGGQLELDGVRMAQKEMPEVLGKKVELVVVDNKTDKVEAANAVKRLIEREKVNVIIGTYGSSLAMAGGDIAEKAGIPMLGTSCTNPLVTQGKKYVFRACFIDPFQGAGAAAFAFNEMKAKKAAILIEVTEDYCVGLAKYFEDNFKKLGGAVVSKMNYQKGDQDFTAQLTEIISLNPDVVYLPANFAEGAIIMRQARELGAEFPFLGGDAMDNPEIVSIGGDSVDGFCFTTFPYDPAMPGMSELAKKFTENWKKAFPDKAANANSAVGYDCYMMIMDSIKRAGSAEPEAITAAMAAMKDYPGVTGMTTIDENHNAIKPVGIMQIKDGKRVYLTNVNVVK
ncbi:MAG: ABC transporter substrate-binding protein [Pyramidobacter sp.]|nr:ABC transporter substrate-binding protein [Pyramidobacter sp.]